MNLTFFLTVLGVGFLLGLRHATDPDHVVAITAILSKSQKVFRHASRVGVLWGIGHSITVTLVGIPIILFSLSIPPKIGLSLEFLVGIMLVILGAVNLSGTGQTIGKKFFPFRIHRHSHPHQKEEHSHFHIHFPEEERHHMDFFQTIRPLSVGLIHGLAGSSAVALLILSTIKDPLFSVFYLLIFHAGVITGMMLITSALGASIILMKKRSQAFNKYLVITSGIFSFLFGLYIMYSTGILIFHK